MCVPFLDHTVCSTLWINTFFTSSNYLCPVHGKNIYLFIWQYYHTQHFCWPCLPFLLGDSGRWVPPEKGIYAFHTELGAWGLQINCCCADDGRVKGQVHLNCLPSPGCHPRPPMSVFSRAVIPSPLWGCTTYHYGISYTRGGGGGTQLLPPADGVTGGRREKTCLARSRSRQVRRGMYRPSRKHLMGAFKKPVQSL